MKKLSDMTLEELWELFPIFLTKPQSCWAEWYEEEKKEIEKLAQCLVKIHHIGSTAIQGIWAKPIIDILVEVENYSEMKNLACLMEKNGYIKREKTEFDARLKKICLTQKAKQHNEKLAKRIENTEKLIVKLQELWGYEL